MAIAAKLDISHNIDDIINYLEEHVGKLIVRDLSGFRGATWHVYLSQNELCYVVWIDDPALRLEFMLRWT